MLLYIHLILVMRVGSDCKIKIWTFCSFSRWLSVRHFSLRSFEEAADSLIAQSVFAALLSLSKRWVGSINRIEHYSSCDTMALPVYFVCSKLFTFPGSYLKKNLMLSFLSLLAYTTNDSRAKLYNFFFQFV